MTIPPGKTPISFLQEISTKRGITPQYDLIANEGAVHEPVFIMRVTVGDIQASGKGMITSEYTNYFYDTSVIFSNFIIMYRGSFTGPTSFALVRTDGPM